MRSITQKLTAMGVLAAGHLMSGKSVHAEYPCSTEFDICHKENGYICQQNYFPIRQVIFTCCDKTTHEPSWGGVCSS